MTPGPGRRPGDPAVTRRTILEAARREFGTSGFDRASIRGIAAAADVDPALIHHHFTDKQQLFVAAHELAIDPDDLFSSVADLPVEQRGAALVDGYLRVFTAPESTALSMLRAAATNERAAAMLREFIGRALVNHGPEIIEGDDPELRMALIGSHLVGIAFARELVGIDPLRRADVADLVEVVAPVVQRYIDAPTEE
jgi:AcrR family transcriptional regulator